MFAMRMLISEIKTFFERLTNKSDSDNQRLQKDLNSIGYASSLLDISEFRFFKLAYSQWYGQDILDSQLENVFAEYMFEDSIPHWVRHLTRKIIDNFNIKTLDPIKFDIIHPQATKKLRSTGIRYIVFLLFLLVGFCYLLVNQPTPY